jgi:hypothetical protein
MDSVKMIRSAILTARLAGKSPSASLRIPLPYLMNKSSRPSKSQRFSMPRSSNFGCPLSGTGLVRRRNGISSPEGAIQLSDDDTANPAMLPGLDGEALWNRKDGAPSAPAPIAVATRRRA